jgi:hypothetical protein
LHEITEYCSFVGLFCKYVYKYRPLYYVYEGNLSKTRVQNNRNKVYIEILKKGPTDSAIQECLVSKLQRPEWQ